jgi:hypothetical protein
MPLSIRTSTIRRHHIVETTIDLYMIIGIVLIYCSIFGPRRYSAMSNAIKVSGRNRAQDATPDLIYNGHTGYR